MFKFAQQIVRHKIGFVTVAAFAVFVFTKDSHEEAAKPSSPWAAQGEAVLGASASGEGAAAPGMVDKAMAAVGEYLGEATGINPVEMTDQTVNSFNDTAEAMKKANGN